MVYLYVGVGGAIGSFFRYVLSQISFPVWNHFPIGTLLVNLIGTFLLGWLTARIMPSEKMSHAMKTGISTGIIGSFTTFSTLSVESVQLINQSHFAELGVYLSFSLVGGIILSAYGYYIGQRGVANS